jgi:hypothetical protein
MKLEGLGENSEPLLGTSTPGFAILLDKVLSRREGGQSTCGALDDTLAGTREGPRGAFNEAPRGASKRLPRPGFPARRRPAAGRHRPARRCRHS